MLSEISQEVCIFLFISKGMEYANKCTCYRCNNVSAIPCFLHYVGSSYILSLSRDTLSLFWSYVHSNLFFLLQGERFLVPCCRKESKELDSTSSSTASWLQHLLWLTFAKSPRGTGLDLRMSCFPKHTEEPRSAAPAHLAAQLGEQPALPAPGTLE